MEFYEAIEVACKEPTLVDALGSIAVWENERVVQQAKKFFETGERTGSGDAAWDTCFTYLFNQTIKAWVNKNL